MEQPSVGSSAGGGTSNGGTRGVGEALSAGRLVQAASESGSTLASAVTDQAKTLTATLEDTGLKHPLGAMGAALVVGMLIALVGRTRH